MSNKKTALTVPGKRPLWRDPRFLLGLALIALSIIVCTLLITKARAGVDLYQTTADIAEGEEITASNTRIVTVRPGSDVYIQAGALQPGSIARRSIGANELLAQSAVAEQDDETKRRLVITVADGLPQSVRPGDELELWTLPSSNAGSAGATESSSVAGNVILVSVIEQSPSISQQGTRIEIRFDAPDLPKILSATAQGTRLAAVPVGSK